MRLKNIIPLPLIVIIGMAASLAKFWVGPPKKILVYTKEAGKVNLLIPWQLAITILLPKKTKNKARET